MLPFDGSGVEWHEKLPSPYTYQESDFAKLIAAVHEYEARLLQAEAALRRFAEMPFENVKGESVRIAAREALRESSSNPLAPERKP